MKRYLLPILLLIFMVSCASTVRVSDIKQRPRQYHDKKLTIYGTVSDVITLPILGIGVYQVDDGTGEIWVKPHGEAPYKGDRVRVTGTVKVGLEISGKTFGLILMENSPEDDESTN